MIKTFCDRCGKETTDAAHGSINGIEDADDNGSGTCQAPDCFDIVCNDCFAAWRAWMKPASTTAIDPHAHPSGTLTPRET